MSTIVTYFIVNAIIAFYGFYKGKSISKYAINLFFAVPIYLTFTIYAFVVLFYYKSTNNHEGCEYFVNTKGKIK